MKELQDQAIEGYHHDYCSLAEIQSQTPFKSDLIKTLFVFENYYMSDEAEDQSDHKLSIKKGENREQTNYDLTFSTYLIKEQLSYHIMYNPRKYEKDEIQRILKRVKMILNEIIEHPNRLVQEIAFITKEEELIFNQFNDTEVAYPKEKTIIEWFEEQVKKTPDHVAVRFEGESLTYREVNERANRLGHQLRTLGVKPNEFVALMVERGFEMIIGMLGILKAGGAYVPLDPTYPEKRIKYMLERLFMLISDLFQS